MTHQLRGSENQHPKRRDEEGRAVQHMQKNFSYHTLLSYDRDKYVLLFVCTLRHYIFCKRSQGTASALLSGTWSTGSTSTYPYASHLQHPVNAYNSVDCCKTGVVTPWSVTIFYTMLVLTYCWVSHLNPTYLALSEMQGWKRGFRAMAIGGNTCWFCAGTEPLKQWTPTYSGIQFLKY